MLLTFAEHMKEFNLLTTEKKTSKKNRILFCFLAFISVLSLQSCVTNYVVASKPVNYTPKNTAYKLSSLNSKKIIEDNRSTLKSNTASLNNLKLANAENILKSAEIEKAIRYSKTIDGILNEAETYIGTPYRFGGMTRNGIDCSAFVLSVFGVAGVDLPRVASAQSQEGEKVEKEDLQKGDLIFFSQGRGRISHVAIVYEVTPEAEVKFIHAATSKGVMVSSLSDSYWGPKFRLAKRIITAEEGSDDAVNN